MDIVPRRKITCPQRYRCYERLANAPSEEEDCEEADEDYVPKKKKKKKPKNRLGLQLDHFAAPVQVPKMSDNRDSLPEVHQLPVVDLLQDANDDRKKHGANAYVCDECGKVLRSKDTLVRHKISHSGSKPFICDICDKGFSSAVSLKEHKAKHDNKMLYECSVCSKQFRQNSCYCRHLQTHSKIQPHVCHICNRRFTLKDYLRSHMKKHTGERKYVCSQCKKAFAHQSDLNRHKITHTGDRPYKCDICGLSFSDNSSRRRHIKDHDAGSKSYFCSFCSSSFNSAHLLEQHVKKNHSSLPGSCETKKTSEIGNSVEIQVIKENSHFCSSALPLSSSIMTLHAAEQAPAHKFSSEIMSPSKADNCEITVCRNFLDPGDYSNSYIELETSLQTAPAADFKEALSLTPPENIHIQVADTENAPYRYYSEMDQLQKSLPNCVPEVQSLPSTSQVDYVAFPDFNNENYYSWLSEFTSLCKLLDFPIDSELFNKISQVHKSIADILADPSGLLCSKNNFKFLRNISQDLLQVTNGHLNFIYDHLQE